MNLQLSDIRREESNSLRTRKHTSSKTAFPLSLKLGRNVLGPVSNRILAFVIFEEVDEPSLTTGASTSTRWLRTHPPRRELRSNSTIRAFGKRRAAWSVAERPVRPPPKMAIRVGGGIDQVGGQRWQRWDEKGYSASSQLLWTCQWIRQVNTRPCRALRYGEVIGRDDDRWSDFQLCKRIIHSREKCEITRNQSNKIAEILVYRHIKTNLWGTSAWNMILGGISAKLPNRLMRWRWRIRNFVLVCWWILRRELNVIRTRIQTRREKLLTICARESLFAFLKVLHFFNDFLDYSFEFSHLCFETRKGFLIRNGTLRKSKHRTSGLCNKVWCQDTYL